MSGSPFILGLDTETTGLDYQKGHRIIEFYGGCYRISDRVRFLEVNKRISPEGKAIDKKAQEVHGIDASMLIGKPTFKMVAPVVHKLLSSATAVVVHNAAFDIPFLAFELAQAGFEFPSNLAIFDTMTEGMTASYDGKVPSLREFCWAMGIEYDPTAAHAADYDVDVMMRGFFRAVDYGYFDLSALTDRKDAA